MKQNEYSENENEVTVDSEIYIFEETNLDNGFDCDLCAFDNNCVRNYRCTPQHRKDKKDGHFIKKID